MPDSNSLPEFVRVERNGRVALVHPEYRDAVADALLEGKGCQASGHIGRGTLQRFPYDAGTAVLRRYRRGGFIRHFLKETYLFVNRPLRELEVHRAAYDAGLSVPMPLGVSWDRRGPLFRGAIASAELDAVHLLDFLKQPGANLDETLDSCGAAIRRMHEAGIVHADLQIRNILLKNGQAYLIDFDNARRKRIVSSRGRDKNLDRLRRSFERTGVSLEYFKAIETGYARAE